MSYQSPLSLPRQSTLNKVHVCEHRAAAAGLDQQKVIEDTARFISVMHGAPNLETKKHTLDLLQHGLVDLGASYGTRADPIWKTIYTDPGFCFQALWNNNAFRRAHKDMSVSNFINHAFAKNWMATLSTMLEMPSFRNAVLHNAEKIICDSRGPAVTTFTTALYEKAEKQVTASQFITQALTHPKQTASLAAWIERGWEPNLDLVCHTLSEKYESYKTLLATGVTLTALQENSEEFIRIYNRRKPYQQIGTAHKQALLEYFLAQETRWEAVKTSLDAQQVAALTSDDLLAAAHMGNDALGEFLHPSHWRADRTHLQALVDAAPIQIQNRIQRECPLAHQAMQQRATNHAERLANNTAWGAQR